MDMHAEHAEGPSVIKVEEMVGVSRVGWEAAAREIVERTSLTVRHITGLDLIRSTAVVSEGKILEHHVTAKVAYIVEPAVVGQ
jgi:flavin-binding protein dodecin